MTARRTLIRRGSSWTEGESRTMLGSMAGVDPAAICFHATVLLVHHASGAHQVAVVTDGDSSPEEVALVLEHALRHMRGTCDQCPAGGTERNTDECQEG